MVPPENLRIVGVRRMKNIVSAADHAAMHEHYSFLPPETSRVSNNSRVRDADGKIAENGPKSGDSSWQERMVSKYHEHLFKEFALADLSIPGKIGLRWRSREEVISGRGESSCGNKRCKYKNDSVDELVTLEVPFSYKERGERKKELVKLKLCVNCRPLLQNSTTKSTSTTGTSSSKKESERSEDTSGNLSDGVKTKKRVLKNSKRVYKKEKKRKRNNKT